MRGIWIDGRACAGEVQEGRHGRAEEIGVQETSAMAMESECEGEVDGDGGFPDAAFRGADGDDPLHVWDGFLGGEAALHTGDLSRLAAARCGLGKTQRILMAEESRRGAEEAARDH